MSVKGPAAPLAERNTRSRLAVAPVTAICMPVLAGPLAAVVTVNHTSASARLPEKPLQSRNGS